MKITGDDILNLMYKSIYDDKIIQTIEILGMKQPLIDEQYEKDKEVSILDDDNIGISLTFEEIEGYTKEGEPCLTIASIKNINNNELPYNLNFNDNYNQCVEKLGKKADFVNKRLRKSKIWLIKLDNNLSCTMSINFKNTEFEEIKNIVFVNFNKNDVGNRLLENKE